MIHNIPGTIDIYPILLCLKTKSENTMFPFGRWGLLWKNNHHRAMPGVSASQAHRNYCLRRSHLKQCIIFHPTNPEHVQNWSYSVYQNVSGGLVASCKGMKVCYCFVKPFDIARGSVAYTIQSHPAIFLTNTLKYLILARWRESELMFCQLCFLRIHYRFTDELVVFSSFALTFWLMHFRATARKAWPTPERAHIDVLCSPCLKGAW